MQSQGWGFEGLTEGDLAQGTVSEEFGLAVFAKGVAAAGGNEDFGVRAVVL